MKKRLTKGWTFTRVLYVTFGIAVVVQSIVQQQWLGILLGGYFASMGLFSFGCAAGGCLTGAPKEVGNDLPAQANAPNMQEVTFEEIKQ